MLEHFEDNLNTNITNKRNLANFLKVAKTVRKNLTGQYGPDVFDDPALTDPVSYTHLRAHETTIDYENKAE